MTRRAAGDFIKLEDFRLIAPRDRVRGTFTAGVSTLLEVVLHAGESEEGQRILVDFAKYLHSLKVPVDLTKRVDVGGLSFIPVRADGGMVERVATFSYIREVRNMPRLRQPDFPERAGNNKPFPVQIPVGKVLDRTIKVAVFDGGVPDIPALARYVTRHSPDGVKAPVREF